VLQEMTLAHDARQQFAPELQHRAAQKPAADQRDASVLTCLISPSQSCWSGPIRKTSASDAIGFPERFFKLNRLTSIKWPGIAKPRQALHPEHARYQASAVGDRFWRALRCINAKH